MIKSTFPSPTPTEAENGLHFEEEYGRIGWWKGPRPSAELRHHGRVFWTAAGEVGLHWLLARLRTERHIDVLSEAASLLADLGPQTIEPILEELESSLVGDQGIALLAALGSFKPADAPRLGDRLGAVIENYLGHPSLELREGACKATAILPMQQALSLLQKALTTEQVQSVREMVEETIVDRQPEQE